MNSSYSTDPYSQSSQFQPATSSQVHYQNPTTARSNPAQPRTAPPPLEAKSPRSIAELAEITRQSLGEDTRPFKIWLQIAETARRDAKSFQEKGDLEASFIEFARAATIVLEKIPSHPDYRVLLTPTQIHNVGLNGQDLLDRLAEIKVVLMGRHEQWRANPSSAQFLSALAPVSNFPPQQLLAPRSIQSDGASTPSPSSRSSSPGRGSMPPRSPDEEDRAWRERTDAMLRDEARRRGEQFRLACEDDERRRRELEERERRRLAEQRQHEQNHILRQQQEAELAAQAAKSGPSHGASTSTLSSSSSSRSRAPMPPRSRTPSPHRQSSNEEDRAWREPDRADAMQRNEGRRRGEPPLSADGVRSEQSRLAREDDVRRRREHEEGERRRLAEQRQHEQNGILRRQQEAEIAAQAARFGQLSGQSQQNVAILQPSVQYPSAPMPSTSAPIKRAAPQSTTGASVGLPAAAPALSAPAQFSFATLTPSHSPTFPAGVAADDAIAPSSTWWNNLKRKRMNPIEKAEGYARTRSRAIEAIGGTLGMAASIGHEVLFTGVDLLQYVPVPGLDLAGNILLSIWDAVELVETNRLASLRLIERCANILISIRGEIADAGYTVAEELSTPIKKLVKAFEEVRSCLNKLGQSPFLKRYLKRDEILSNISACDTSLNDARETFNSSVQIRMLKLVKSNELRQKEMHQMLGSLSHVSPTLAPSAAIPSLPTDTESVRSTLHAVRSEQNAQDRAHDMSDLHRLMLTALSANDDIAVIEVLQIARSEMPDAIRTLERALERLLEDGKVDAEKSTTALPSQKGDGSDNSPSLEPGNAGASHSSTDKLDREFIVTGIDALRRLSKGTDLGLPSWTITQFEVELEEKVGFGFFSEVFRGTWRKHTVAVKVLDKTAPRNTFLREVKIWKSLYHPNVLELFGASSASGEPPWFLVCKYYPQGNLVKYLKGLSKADAARIDAVKMIFEISKGMAYLHEQDVLHGDLKAANILVADDTSCVISDFGQSEIKSEVYRLTGASQPRGTLRWQAPELMEGAQILRPEMDVYAFAICCWEILNMGALPWPLTDDSTVRHLVLNKDMRPELPPSNLVGGHLMNVIRLSWDRVPSKRLSFEKIIHELRKQRAGWRA